MQRNYKIAYWLRTDIQHFAHIRPIYDNLGGVILTKNPTIYNYLKENFPYLCEDLLLVKNSTEAKKIINRMDTKLVVYTGFQMIFWGYSVQVFHGASDKHYLLEHKRILLYDLLLLPGNKHMEKICSIYKLKHPEKFKIVGYPKFDKLVLKTIASTPLFNNGKPTILYAPTWITEGSGTKLKFSSHGESSLPLWGVKLIRAISPEWNLIIKYHSRIYESHRDVYRKIDQCITELGAEDSVKVVLDSDITQYMNQADLMISDISAVCYEWFHTNRPILFANPAPDHYRPSTDEISNTYAWQAGDVLYKEEDILPAIRQNLASDTHRAIRNKLLNHSFYMPDGHATERQLAEIVKLYDKVEKQSKFRMVCHNLSVFIRDSIRHAAKKMEKS
ncbi:MAG: CDP-glycerol glycerophosphotransferase family protein [Candidatus Sabulitectum sp.]|nr:CDP-glycerol glycerophosphotransferase family protein [Candidatus Sabulitectum sp.]